MLPIWSLCRRGPDTSNVGSGESLGDGQTHELLAGETLFGDFIPQLGVAQPLPDSSQRDHQARHVAVLEPSGHGPRQLLRTDHVVEIVKVLTLDAAQQRPPVQMLPGTHAHRQRIVRRHLIRQLLRDIGSVTLLLLRLGVHIPIDKLTQGLLQLPMALVVVRRRISRRQPDGLRVGDLAQITGLGINDLALLARNGPDLQRPVFLQHLLSVQVVKGLGRIRARDLLQHHVASRVCVDKVRQVVHLVVDDAPETVFRVVLGHFLPRIGL